MTFEEIVAFYYFDETLRTLFLRYILHVERYIKLMVSYYFSEKYGEHQSAYLSENNYNCSKKNIFEIKKLVKSLSKSISIPSRYAYITHHAKRYENIPLWVAMNAFTFGQVSKMYQYASTDIRAKISKRFGKVSEKQLHQLITIPDMPLHSKLKISQKNGHYIYGSLCFTKKK